MKIMKFAHAGKPRLHHLDVDGGGNRFELIGRDLCRKAIHQISPAPEVVLGGLSIFSQTRHGPLKGVRMEIRHSRQDRALGMRRIAW